MPLLIGPSTYPKRATVAAGAAGLIVPGRAPWTLSVEPGAGGTVDVEVTVTPLALMDAVGAGGIWHALESAQTDPTLHVFPGPVTAIRVTAAVAAAIVEIAP